MQVIQICKTIQINLLYDVPPLQLFSMNEYFIKLFHSTEPLNHQQLRMLFSFSHSSTSFPILTIKILFESHFSLINLSVIAHRYGAWEHYFLRIHLVMYLNIFFYVLNAKTLFMIALPHSVNNTVEESDFLVFSFLFTPETFQHST